MNSIPRSILSSRTRCELFVEGPCVMLGYWGRRDAFTNVALTSGDLVSRREDGALMYTAGKTSG